MKLDPERYEKHLQKKRDHNQKPEIKARNAARQKIWWANLSPERRAEENRKKTVLERARKYKRKPRSAEYRNRHSKRVAANLTDAFLRVLIKKQHPGLETADIPKDLIELKRASMTLKRLSWNRYYET